MEGSGIGGGVSWTFLLLSYLHLLHDSTYLLALQLFCYFISGWGKSVHNGASGGDALADPRWDAYVCVMSVRLFGAILCLLLYQLLGPNSG